MTREEAIEFGNMWLQINEDCKDSNTYKFFQMAIKTLKQEPVLDKVKQAREEIENLNLNDYGDNLYQFQAKCTEILDRLIESE